MKFILYTSVFLILSEIVLAQAHVDPIHIWPDEVPLALGEKHPPVQTADTSRGVTRITDITDPILEAFIPHPHNITGNSVIILPGGAYQYLAVNIEGYEIAEWFQRQGIAAFVLHYRVPNQEEAALLDAQQAIRILKSKSYLFLKFDKVGVIGFSAGGNLAAKLTPNVSDSDIDSSEIPDFSMLIYPAFLAEGPDSSLSEDVNINELTPPTFIFSTNDDPYSAISAHTYADALKNFGIETEFNQIPLGGHGYGLRPGNIAAETWPVLAEKWLRENVLK